MMGDRDQDRGAVSWGPSVRRYQTLPTGRLHSIFRDQIRQRRNGGGAGMQLLAVDRINSIAGGVVEVEVVR